MTQQASTPPLRLAVLGLDARAENLFRMFFRGPCQDSAIVVAAESAQATLIDLDVPQGKQLLQTQRAAKPDQIIILLSINDIAPDSANVVFVKKPAQAQAMMKAIEYARELATNQGASKAPPPTDDVKPAIKVIRNTTGTGASPRQAAVILDEQVFKSYLGYREDIDPSDPKQRAFLFYRPKDFLQGHVESAWEIACTRELPTRLETPWRSLSFLPSQRLVHVDADEAQLRAACSIPFQNIASVDIGVGEKQALSNVRTVTPEEVEALLDSGRLTPIECFLWKIALLTSKGRLPETLNPADPVGLKAWPNMTRLLLPPYAMRIASLLVHTPTAPFLAAKKLGVRQQYVFAFISAADAVGLIERRSTHNRVTTATLPIRPERVSLLKKLLARLNLA